MSETRTGRFPITPDGRYCVVRGRLARCGDPALTDEQRLQGLAALIAARSAARRARRRGDAAALAVALDQVNAAKVALGQRGLPWWRDAAPDMSQRPVAGTPYAAWFSALRR